MRSDQVGVFWLRNIFTIAARRRLKVTPLAIPDQTVWPVRQQSRTPLPSADTTSITKLGADGLFGDGAHYTCYCGAFGDKPRRHLVFQICEFDHRLDLDTSTP